MLTLTIPCDSRFTIEILLPAPESTASLPLFEPDLLLLSLFPAESPLRGSFGKLTLLESAVITVKERELLRSRLGLRPALVDKPYEAS